MALRGIRGATTVAANSAEEILAATQSLLEEIVRANGIRAEEVAAAFFTVTPDLDAAFPAQAARQLGWQYVPLLDAQEIPVPGSLPRCIRVLVLWNTTIPQHEVIHVYQGGAQSLRPDLVGLETSSRSKKEAQ